MKTALLGGSFDPVHLGHLFLLHCAVSLTDYRRFVIMPAKQSNFKRESTPSASDEQRLAMLNLALEDYREIYPQDNICSKVLEISDMEINRGGISYTIDTVNALLEQKCNGTQSERIGVIIGDDHIALLQKWYRFEELKDKVEFLICRRNNERAGFENIKLPSGVVARIIQADNVSPESATDIRKDVMSHLNYLSPRVREYVVEHKLYV